MEINIARTIELKLELQKYSMQTFKIEKKRVKTSNTQKIEKRVKTSNTQPTHYYLKNA